MKMSVVIHLESQDTEVNESVGLWYNLIECATSYPTPEDLEADLAEAFTVAKT